MIKSTNIKRRKSILHTNDDVDEGFDIDKSYKTEILDSSTNQIYFYDDVTKQSILNLNKNIDIIARNLLHVQLSYNLLNPPPIELYISSNGGDVFSAFSTVDRIINSKVPIHSYVEGVAASAATLLSVVAHKRFIRRNSFMLIHQINGGLWGNFSQFKDEMQNLELLMTFIKNIYLTHTKFTQKELDCLLDRDIYLNSEECLKFGLVDGII